jgi:hypothetical protein
MPNPDYFRSTDTRPSNDGRSGLYRRIAYCNSLVYESLVSANPDSPIPDSSGSSATYPCGLDGSDLIGKSRIAISYCNGSTLLNSPMSEIPIPPRTPTRVLPRSTARIHSRDFENHKASIIRLNKNPDSPVVPMTSLGC